MGRLETHWRIPASPCVNAVCILMLFTLIGESGTVVSDEVSNDQVPPILTERLQLHVGVFQNWIARTCQLTSEQLQRLKTVSEAEIGVLQNSAHQLAQLPPPGGLSQHAPLEFTSLAGVTECTSRSLLQFQIVGLLSEDQSTKLESTVKERQQWLSSADRAYLISVLDEELSLSPDQWLLLDEQIRVNPVSNGLFFFEPGDSPLTYTSQLAAGSRLGEIPLSEEQRQKCVRRGLPGVAFQDPRVHVNEFPGLQRPAPDIALRFRDLGEDHVEQALNDAIRSMRSRFEQAIASRVAMYQRAWQLDSGQVVQLKLAATGATIRILSEWKAASRKNLVKPAEQDPVRQGKQSQVVVFGSYPQLDTLVFAHPIWTGVLETLRPQETLKPDYRETRRRQAVIDWALATLDRELWLRHEQREQMRALVEKTLDVRLTAMQQPGRELAFLAVVLDANTVDARNSVLDEDQLRVWQLLRQQFQYESNSVKILRHDGTWFSLEHP